MYTYVMNVSSRKFPPIFPGIKIMSKKIDISYIIIPRLPRLIGLEGKIFTGNMGI